MDSLVNCRAVIEYRAMWMKYHVTLLTGDTTKETITFRLITGGVYRNKEIIQIFLGTLHKPIEFLGFP